MPEAAAHDLLSRAVRAELSRVACPEYAFTCEGAFWHLTFNGKTTHVSNGIGSKYIALLLANPNRELLYGRPFFKILVRRDGRLAKSFNR